MFCVSVDTQDDFCSTFLSDDTLAVGEVSDSDPLVNEWWPEPWAGFKWPVA